MPTRIHAFSHSSSTRTSASVLRKNTRPLTEQNLASIQRPRDRHHKTTVCEGERKLYLKRKSTKRECLICAFQVQPS